MCLFFEQKSMTQKEIHDFLEIFQKTVRHTFRQLEKYAQIQSSPKRK